MSEQDVYEELYANMLDGMYDDEFYDSNFQPYIGASIRRMKGACRERSVNFHNFIRFLQSKEEQRND